MGCALAQLLYARLAAAPDRRLTREELEILTQAILFAEAEIRPTVREMIDEGKTITNKEHCEMVADRVCEIVSGVERKEAKE